MIPNSEAAGFVRAKPPIKSHRHKFPQSYAVAGGSIVNVTDRELQDSLDIGEEPLPVTELQLKELRRSRCFDRVFVEVPAPTKAQKAAADVPDDSPQDHDAEEAPDNPEASEKPAKAPDDPEAAKRPEDNPDDPEAEPEPDAEVSASPKPESVPQPVADVSSMQEAAEFLMGKDVPHDDLLDTSGRLHHAKVRSAGEAHGYAFPNW